MWTLKFKKRFKQNIYLQRTQWNMRHFEIKLDKVQIKSIWSNYKNLSSKFALEKKKIKFDKKKVLIAR